MPFPDFYPAEQVNKGPAHDRKDTRDQYKNYYVPEIPQQCQKEQNTEKDQDIP